MNGWSMNDRKVKKLPIELLQLLGKITISGSSGMTNECIPFYLEIITSNLKLASQKQLAKEDENKTGPDLFNKLTVKASKNSNLDTLLVIMRSSLFFPRTIKSKADILAYAFDCIWSFVYNIFFGWWSALAETFFKGVGTLCCWPIQQFENQKTKLGRLLCGVVGVLGLIIAQPFFLMGNMFSYARKAMDSIANMLISAVSYIGKIVANIGIAMWNKVNKTEQYPYLPLTLDENYETIFSCIKTAFFNAVKLCVTVLFLVGLCSPAAPIVAGLALAGGIALAAAAIHSSQGAIVGGIIGLGLAAASTAQTGLAGTDYIKRGTAYIKSRFKVYIESKFKASNKVSSRQQAPISDQRGNIKTNLSPVVARMPGASFAIYPHNNIPQKETGSIDLSFSRNMLDVYSPRD